MGRRSRKQTLNTAKGDKCKCVCQGENHGILARDRRVEMFANKRLNRDYSAAKRFLDYLNDLRVTIFKHK